MKAGILGVAASVVLAGTCLASGTAPAFVSIMPHGASAQAGGYRFDLGEPDDARAPQAWQGPIRIIRRGKTGCTVGGNVAIVEQPLALVRGHLFYVTTYSGSEVWVYVVDTRSCAVRWTSRRFAGVPGITAETLILPGRRASRIGADGLPAQTP